jgi:hypothetical protein
MTVTYTYYNSDTPTLDTVLGLQDGSLRLRVRLHGAGLTEKYPSGDVLDTDGSIIGRAESYTYGGRAFAVSTPNFGGFVEFKECEYVDSI